MNNKQLSQNFANGAIKGKGSNMFIEGDTIYSYGYHFPIAKRFNGIYLVNSDGYSNSTSKQQGRVRDALAQNNSRIIECPECDINKAINYLDNLMIEYKGKQSRARKADYTRYIEKIQDMISTFMETQFPL